MTSSGEFTHFLLEQMAGFGTVTARRMFGGVGLYRDGLMFALVADDTLYLKSDAGNAEPFDAEDLAPFTYATKNGSRGVMSYRRAPERCLEDPDEMAQWCRLAYEAALRSLKPGKARKPKATKRRPAPA